MNDSENINFPPDALKNLTFLNLEKTELRSFD